MPLKPGPNGTMRKYSSFNGRYEKMTIDEMFSYFANNKKATKEQKKINRQKDLDARAAKSKDPYLYEVYKFIESRFPYSTEFINEKVFINKISGAREMDIITKKCIIEIKSGKKPRASTQGLIQKDYASKHGRKAIIYAPNILPRVKLEYQKHGLTICSNKDELYKEMK